MSVYAVICHGDVLKAWDALKQPSTRCSGESASAPQLGEEEECCGFGSCQELGHDGAERLCAVATGGGLLCE
jgi:hypothetical protein